MKRILSAALVLVLLAIGLSGCASPSGNREYVPGKGWVNTD